ncbi:MAG: VPLPA-CTERM sorting domain-containing protein [Pseudomonadota bacterium]
MIKSTLRITAMVALIAGFAQSGQAATYTIVSGLTSGTVTGTIETDGTLGVLSTANIVDWNITVDGTGGVFNLLGDGSVGDNSDVLVTGTTLEATATLLTFDFSSGGVALFQSPTTASSENFACFAASTCGEFSDAITSLAGTDFPGDIDVFPQVGVVTIATADAPPADDPNVIPVPASLPLLAGGLLGLGAIARRRRPAA